MQWQNKDSKISGKENNDLNLTRWKRSLYINVQSSIWFFGDYPKEIQGWENTEGVNAEEDAAQWGLGITEFPPAFVYSCVYEGGPC